jgi:hypothetical protein
MFVLFLLLATWLLTQHVNKEELNETSSSSSISSSLGGVSNNVGIIESYPPSVTGLVVVST